MAAVSDPVRELAQGDDAGEDEADDQHRLDHLLAFFCGSRSEHDHRGAMLTDTTRMQLEGPPHLAVLRRPRPASLVALAERGGSRSPRLAVAGQAVSAKLGAARDQRGESGHGLDGPGLGDADEPVRVEVVAEQERGVAVGRREQARRPVME